jgi:hypothetical protein
MSGILDLSVAIGARYAQAALFVKANLPGVRGAAPSSGENAALDRLTGSSLEGEAEATNTPAIDPIVVLDVDAISIPEKGSNLDLQSADISATVSYFDFTQKQSLWAAAGKVLHD